MAEAEAIVGITTAEATAAVGAAAVEIVEAGAAMTAAGEMMVAEIAEVGRITSR
jgi:hypothetical protein